MTSSGRQSYAPSTDRSPMAELIAQAGVVPYRRGEQGPEFCVITSTSSRRWGFPKGIIEWGATPTATALQEALEEAGLHGQIVGEPLGRYRYRKWGSELEVTVFLMEVSSDDETWDESDVRERAWLTADQAAARLDRPELLGLLDAAVGRLS